MGRHVSILRFGIHWRPERTRPNRSRAWPLSINPDMYARALMLLMQKALLVECVRTAVFQQSLLQEERFGSWRILLRDSEAMLA